MAKGKLYLIPTVISPDTQDSVLSKSIRDEILNINTFLVENVRTARRFISSLKLGITIEELRFEELNKRTRIEDLISWMKPINKGESIGVISESGCPGVADPGSLAVELAHSFNIKVVPLVGPSSILLTLMASGLNGQKFAFHGYLPIDIQTRNSALAKLEKESRNNIQTQLFMETPYRNEKLFRAILQVCRPDTRLCVACDVTGSNEWIKTLSIKKWKNEKTLPIHKLPTVFAILA